jgi:predicted transcriptional regulator
LAGEAIESFLDWDDDFRAAVLRGVAEADAGAFAADKDIERVFRKRT